MLRALILLTLTATALPAYADGEILRVITPADTERLANYDTVRAEALRQARDGGAAGDVAVLEQTIAASGESFADFDMTGEWRCRTMKLGKNLPLVVYAWFRCTVKEDGAGWQLTKTSGSQRTEGRFFTESDTRLTYLGTGFIAGDSPVRYGGGPEHDQAGYAYRTGADAFRIEFPSPARESLLDILELRR